MSKDPNLIVTLGGRPVPDQALGIRAFKDACLASSKTPPPQSGEWTLTAPDGRTWKADSPLKCCGLEQRERVPANVALARIVEEMERFDAEEAAKAASAQETLPLPPTLAAGHPVAYCARETPADLVGALQDKVHTDAGPFRAGQSVKETPVDCPKCGFLFQSIAHFEHCGHGHVVERHDGMKTRCGGPSMCSICTAEQVAINQP